MIQKRAIYMIFFQPVFLFEKWFIKSSLKQDNVKSGMCFAFSRKWMKMQMAPILVNFGGRMTLSDVQPAHRVVVESKKSDRRVVPQNHTHTTLA